MGMNEFSGFLKTRVPFFGQGAASSFSFLGVLRSVLKEAILKKVDLLSPWVFGIKARRPK